MKHGSTSTEPNLPQITTTSTLEAKAAYIEDLKIHSALASLQVS